MVSESEETFMKVPGSEALYDHFTNVLLNIIKESPADPLNSFENVSAALKQAPAITATPTDEEQQAALLAHQGALDLIKAPKKSAGDGDEEEEEEEEEKEQAPIPDLMAEMSLLEWPGVGLSAEDMYKWVLSIQNLATAKELINVRFWGIIRGTKKDYYIVEAKLEEYPEPEDGEEGESKNEAMGQGANEHLYFVANTATGVWTALPAVEAKQIILARQMRSFFTGDLDADVLGFPRFPQPEKFYLRAQIARITAGAFLCPSGVLTVDPEDEDLTVTENEEYAGITPMLMGANSWIHARTHLLMEGRTTAFVSADAEEEEEEEDEDAPPKVNPDVEIPPPPLREVAKDEGSAWKFGVFPHAADPNAVASATCTRWPGATTVAQGKTFVNFYNGYGHKLSTTRYAPPSPPAMAVEYDFSETAEPLLEETDIQPPEGWTPPEEKDEEEEEAAEAPKEEDAEEED